MQMKLKRIDHPASFHDLDLKNSPRKETKDIQLPGKRYDQLLPLNRGLGFGWNGHTGRMNGRVFPCPTL
jgi:hypothetical protein